MGEKFRSSSTITDSPSLHVIKTFGRNQHQEQVPFITFKHRLREILPQTQEKKPRRGRGGDRRRYQANQITRRSCQTHALIIGYPSGTPGQRREPGTLTTAPADRGRHAEVTRRQAKGSSASSGQVAAQKAWPVGLSGRSRSRKRSTISGFPAKLLHAVTLLDKCAATAALP